MTDINLLPTKTPPPKPRQTWLGFAFATVILWGVWGALTGLSSERGYPETLVYCVWALTMIPPALIVLSRVKWKLDISAKAMSFGLAIGLLGAGGQMILFYTLTIGPAYLVFPVISLSPLITIALSYAVLKERTSKIGAIGIVLALIALPLFDFSFGADAPGGGLGWFALALVIMACWGLQAYFMRAANAVMKAESIFFYMMISGLMLTPVALLMTDFSQPIPSGWDGPGLAAAIQILNAIGALCLVFAFRTGKAIIVAPLTNAGAPLATALISLIIIGVVPGPLKIVALVLATLAAILLSIAPEAPDAAENENKKVSE